MGPLRGVSAQRRRRRALWTLCATLAPAPALAEVCDKVRPFWTPGRPATAVDELLGLMATPPSLVLLVLTALALRLRHAWGALAVVVLWSTWVSFAVMRTPGPTLGAARAEGCIGPPTLFIAVVAAICVATILYTSRRDTRL